ncbi:substrate-binding domain-containing protein [Loktanella sp. DJP18]|uniref:substrate-binding domain-containing protein n=1 Tax=Loktanella sp. DJP18 TaxID=3409788 RepID=UPI003BB62F5D
MIARIALAAALCATSLSAEEMKMAVTTSFDSSGLAEVLLPAIKDDLDIDLQLLVVGTGQAIELGMNGDVDAVLVHSRTAEEDFVASGNATHRREIMYNDFVVIGPADDVAGVEQADTAAASFQAIATAEAPFVSRGDDSGTHKAELTLWTDAGLDPQTFGDWYNAVGAGMGAALNTAAGLNAYILSDRASWLNFGNTGDLALLFAGDPALFNQYAYLPVNPELHPSVRNDLAMKLEDWLVSDTAKALIEEYTIDGEPLFVFNAQAE